MNAIALWPLLAVVTAVPGPDADLGRRVEAYMRPYVQSGNFSGNVLVARGDRVLLERSYGQASYELSVPNAAATRFHVASVSKPFTAAAVLLLVQQGRLTLADPLTRFVPDFPGGSGITVQHLLTHTSGLRDINSAPFYEAESRKPQTPESLVRLVRTLEPAAAPGERYGYSNANYNLLAYVIERASGMSYGEYLRTAILEPLDLRDTGHDGRAEALIPNRAMGYAVAGARGMANAPWFDWSMKTGNGSIYTTTADLHRFVRAMVKGGLLPAGTLERLLTGTTGFAYGWSAGETAGRKAWTIAGRSPGFAAAVHALPEDDLYVVVLSNLYSTVAQTPIAPDLVAIALGKPVPPPQLSILAVDHGTLDALAGRYQGGDDFFFPRVVLDLRRDRDWVVMHWSSGADAILVPIGRDLFLDRTFWAQVRFTRDSGGQVQALVWRYADRDYTAPRVAAVAPK